MDALEGTIALLSALPGARIFPCQPGAKAPAGKWTEENTDDPERVRGFVGLGFNLGLYIGKRLFVIDVEGPNKKNEKSRAGHANLATLKARLGGLPPTPTVETPSGGLHLYFVLPDGIELEKVDPLLGAHGVEGRTGDHYMVAPGSTVDGIEYRFAAGLAPTDVGVAELPAGWIAAIHAAALTGAGGEKKKINQLATTTGRTERADSGPKANFNAMAAGCAFVRHGVDNAATLAEPEWHAWLSLVGNCEDGERIAHKVSSVYPGYDERETADKLTHAVEATPPRTCEGIAAGLSFEGCKGCPFRAAKMASPISLGYQDEALVKVQADSVYLHDTRRYFQLSTGRVASWKSYEESLRVELGSAPHNRLLASKTTPRVWDFDYLAGEVKLIVDNKANTWKLDGVKPVKGDASVFTNFLEFLIPDLVSREHLVNYLSRLLTHPGDKIKHGIIITGPQGTGKSTMARVIGRLFGVNARSIEGARLVDRFNGDRANCQVLLVEEADHGGKYEAYETMKTLITEETVDVEEKNVKVVRGRTPRGIFLFSNHVNPLAIASGDRRFAVLASCEVKAAPSFYSEIHAAIDDDAALGAFADFLMMRASDFNPHVAPPMTLAKEEATKASRPPLVQILAELLEDGTFWRDVLTMPQIQGAIETSGWSVGSKIAITPQRLCVSLKEAGCIALRKTRVRGNTLNLWAVRNVEHWREASPDAIRGELLRGAPPGVVTVHLRAMQGEGAG
jgi:hypothetical protein